VIVDSREQKPLVFKEGVFSERKVEGLPFGDYWAYEDSPANPYPVAVERKSLPDLFGTMGKGYKRFKREIERAHKNGFQLILLMECSMRDVVGGIKQSRRSGDAVLKQVFTLFVRYEVMPVFAGDRRSAARYVEELFSSLNREYKHGDRKGLEDAGSPAHLAGEKVRGS
jgi:ERCC4-type nuclease